MQTLPGAVLAQQAELHAQVLQQGSGVQMLMQDQQYRQAAQDASAQAQLDDLHRQLAAEAGYEEPTSPWLYVGLGIGALALIGVVITARRRKSVSGYRRRRRR